MPATDELDGAIERAVDSLPSSVVSKRAAQSAVEKAEEAAQKRARELDSAIKLRFADILFFCHQVIERAGDRGLVGIKVLGDIDIPRPLMLSAAQLSGSRLLQNSGFVFESQGGTLWQFLVELGYTKSPAALASWNETTDHWFPMIRLHEGRSPVLTIAFDPEMEEIRVVASSPMVVDELKPLLSGTTGVTAVQDALIHLLLRLRANEEQ